MSERPADTFPKGVLYAALALIVVAMGLAGLGRLMGEGGAAIPEDAIVESVDLRFEDRTIGGVNVIDAEDGAVVATLEPGEGGFIRGALRALVRERRSLELGRAQPFRLARSAGGELSLEDLATGERIYIPAFGPSQVEAFGELLAQALERRQ